MWQAFICKSMIRIATIKGGWGPKWFQYCQHLNIYCDLWSMALRLLFKFFFSFAVALCYLHSTKAQGLKVGFYSKTCPDVEAIVQKTTASFISRAPSLSGPLLRMHFHDCFVRVGRMYGFDISFIISSMNTGLQLPEYRADPNWKTWVWVQWLDTFQILDDILVPPNLQLCTVYLFIHTNPFGS